MTKRLGQLQGATAHTLVVYATAPVDTQKPQEAEARAHQLLAPYRKRGEWFDCDPERALNAIRRAAWEAEDGSG